MENIIDEANRCLNCKVKPCQKACPLGNDIPSFIKQVKENNLEVAAVGKIEDIYNRKGITSAVHTKNPILHL